MSDDFDHWVERHDPKPWFEQADYDLDFARLAHANEGRAVVVTLANDSIQKRLAGALIAATGELPRVRAPYHLALALGAALAEETETCFTDGELDALQDLNVAHAVSRYPVNDNASAPEDACSPKEADRALATAERVRERIQHLYDTVPSLRRRRT